MSRRLQQSLSTSTGNFINQNEKKVSVGIVVDVMTSGHKSYDSTLNGRVQIRPMTDSVTPAESLKFYLPLDSNNFELPLKGEIVELVPSGGSFYYRRIANSSINSGNAVENRDSNTFGDDDSSKSSNYKEVSSTGISNSGNSGESRKSKLGEYFEPEQVNPLITYEGDKIIQSRFGQSIRFSGYNNEDNQFSPTIIIRNRQNSESINNLEGGEITEEDVNKDGSTILLSSNKYKINFQPGTIDDKGNTDFETNPINFELPQEYVDYDQMLLSSERIILSAKSQEMIFFSKGNYGFISDGKFTIDNGNGGADLDFGDDVNITTDRNNGNFSVITGTGNILLNTDNTNEAIVRGNTLVDLLTQLIDAINKQTFNTPSGPTALGPNNRADFNDIKSKLRDALSTLNFTE